ncbi:hypothetical protein [Aquimarina sp. AU119]|uniref:hypothetical protein n=1 Tax=Aquimarina sp. AU119 TaxID=2108528 RepID=UPI000D69340D|nr:hypothetical protein [Aquimarina sp. AU119]
MNLHERYLNGETKAVYDDIYKLGSNAFDDSHIKEIEKVMKETFERVLFNLNIIYKELIEIGYLFKTDFEFNFEKPLHLPLENTEWLIKELEFAVKDFGFVPISLKYFYQIVGGVNFIWDFETNDKFIWEMADPIQISSLDSLVEEVTSEYWKEDIQRYADDDEFGCAFLNLSADNLHKDNVSGGQPYAIEITRKPTIDAKFMNEPNETSFINYLRICFDNCGFPGITRMDTNNDYKVFFNKVKPQLKKI